MHNITEKINKINYLRNKTFTPTEELAKLLNYSLDKFYYKLKTETLSAVEISTLIDYLIEKNKISIMLTIERYDGSTYDQLIRVSIDNVQEELQEYAKVLGNSYHIVDYYKL